MLGEPLHDRCPSSEGSGRTRPAGVDDPRLVDVAGGRAGELRQIEERLPGSVIDKRAGPALERYATRPASTCEAACNRFGTRRRGPVFV